MSPRILVVEDVAANRRMLTEMLAEADYTISEAADAGEALKGIRGEEVDLILLDVMLPGSLDGFGLCRWIKGQAEYADLPVIFITALDDTPSKVRGLDLGAADYVTKPFKREEVLARVKTQLRIRQLTQSLTDANRGLTERQEQLEEDLRSAALVQKTFLPEPGLTIPHFQLRWRFTPSAQIGGDIFNVAPVGNGWWAFYLVDVAGHGVPPALVTISVAQSILQELHLSFIRDGARTPSPGSVAKALERQFPMNRFDRYFTIVLLMIEPESGRIVYANAGHPPPVLVRSTSIELLEAGGPPIGLSLRPENEEMTLQLERGDRLFLYTDGLIEQMDPAGEPFGIEGLVSTAEKTRGRDFAAACDGLVEAFDHYRGTRELDDDLALLALQYDPDG